MASPSVIDGGSQLAHNPQHKGFNVATERKLAVGTRVRLPSSSHVVELRSATGTVVRPDRYDGYYVIKLDQPAIYFAADGTTRDLPELVEAVDNLDVLSDPSYH